MTKYNILSPDGFAIHHEDVYDSPEDAWKAFEIWKERYKVQGYYSSNTGRISLESLREYCTLIEENNETIYRIVKI